MTKPISFGKMEVHLTADRASSAGQADPETPFRLLVLGDFSGRANQGAVKPISTADRKPIEVDCDRLDAAMAKLAPSLRLPVGTEPGGGAEITLKFSELEDFHPDRVYDRVELFRVLQQTRKDLLTPSRFEAAAAQVNQWAGGGASIAPVATPKPSFNVSDDDDSFSRLLGQPSPSRSRPGSSPVTTQIDTLLKQVVEPHVVASPHPQQAQMVSAVDAAASKQMRAILHHQDFQALEAGWRALDYLVRHLETSEQLRLFIIDVSKAELEADLAVGDDLASTGIHRLIVESSVGRAGAQPWAAIVGNYTFDATDRDAALLGRVAKIAAAAEAPFLAAAGPRWLGCESLATNPSPEQWTAPVSADAAAAWQSLRGLRESAYVGLTLPRFLLRLPYGSNTDLIEGFDFQEIDAVPNHDDYLWGNAAFLGACLLGHEFGQYGWGFEPGGGYDVEDLPSHFYKQDDQRVMTPCGEAWLSDRAVEKILGAGLMPILSVQGRDAVRYVRFQSIAQPTRNLAGRWGG